MDDADAVRGPAPGRRAGSRGWAVVAAAASLALLAACNAGKPIVPPNDGFAIKLNLLCTTCDDFLDCRRDDAPPASATPGARQPLLVYRLKEKSFWQQIATIGDYLFQAFRQKRTDERPLAIYRDDGERRSVEQVPKRAFIDASAGTIALPDGLIDMKSGAWLDPRGERIGACKALVRRDGYALVRQFLGRAPAAAIDAAPPAGAPDPAPDPAADTAEAAR